MLAGVDTAQTYIGTLLFVGFFYSLVLPVRRTYANLGMRPVVLQLFGVILTILGVAIVAMPIRRPVVGTLARSNFSVKDKAQRLNRIRMSDCLVERVA